MTRAPIRVVQSSAWFAPYNLGGTEVFLEGLALGLNNRGWPSAVIVPRHPQAPARYRHAGLTVSTYGAQATLGEEASLAAFDALLAESGAEIYHQHSWTPDCGAAHLAAAKARGLRTVLTVHVPSNICMRGTMMQFGKLACDGKVRQRLCAACWAQGRGAPNWAAHALSLAPPALGRYTLAARGRLGSALAGPWLAQERQAELASAFAAADQVVAVCQWLYGALLANGAPAGKLSLSRQGVGGAFAGGRLERHTPPADRPLKVLYLGRFDAVKGAHVLIQAVRSRPELPLTLELRGPVAGAEEAAYLASLRSLAAGDDRIGFADAVPREAIANLLLDHDVLAIPSQWLETGPIVALEAQAAGTFILGSRLGGIAELVSPATGRLVEAGDVAAWAEALEALAKLPPRLAPRTVRTMADAAEDMARLYQGLV